MTKLVVIVHEGKGAIFVASVCIPFFSAQITYRVGLRRPGTQWAKYHHVGKRAADQLFRMSVYYDSSVNTE